ncbi:extracellular matrix glycoprotein pherophorin-V2 [Volvox carteri f. nagariensis]|uniref:Extracellular matrix glycoprotein pherophorin-V2 n=1 Tax=Volvox carteri f. nagariensis TaxID=3068 RepID=Q3HTK9_VOLCA|nr:extracellular matrix glycoprotein pherophorin-V2 [Volvox carteri f. nagariensis]ABA41396.1 pherophorin-V2 protein precursor [Volvox carteri f. nagariensis]EFJ40107.1 extracellular matrix glycoprotein pherophorin-V2 [Volvox carteri f. nagariensis]|eukprot:XP_002958856.1 extracellular matrix glycoprotein pherophorin-V2 [Volvox carteri f. nagariensis]
MKLTNVLCIAVAVSLLAGAQAASFPYSSVCAQQPAVYSVESTIIERPNNTYCFKIAVNVPANCAGYCCSADLYKFELSINPICKISGAKLSSTLNGKPTPTQPSIDKAPNEPAGAILRIPNLGLKMSNADGAEICVSLGTNSAGRGCLSLEQLCKPPAGGAPGTCETALWDSKFKCCPTDVTVPNSPLLPPPPINCTCDYKAGSTPFTVGAAATATPTTSGTTVYCLPITTTDTFTPAGCGPVDILHKIEMYANQDQRAAIKSLKLVSGSTTTTLAASWNGANSNTLKFTPINWTKAQAANSKVCVELKNPTTLSDFCLGSKCYLFIFNANRACCPMYTVPV